MIIANRTIDRFHSPFIVAEISSNHGGDYQTCLKLIHQAKECGCDAVKFQAYTPEHMTLDKDLLPLYRKYKTPLSWFSGLFEYARQLELVPFVSVFDPSVIEVFEALECPAYKIASFEKNHFPLIEKIKETRKPIIISTGLHGFNDYQDLQKTFSALNTIILKCVSKYPAKPEEFNLKTIPETIRQGYDVGISDHTTGVGITVASVALGAVMVERHFTLKRCGLPDDDFSLLPHEMANMVKEVRDTYSALGEVLWEINGERAYLRSVYAIADIKEGEKFTTENTGLLRPNKGVDPKSYFKFLRSRASQYIKKGTPLHFRHIK